MVFDGPDRLYVGEVGNHTVRAITLSTGQVSTYAGLVSRAAVRLGALSAGLNEPVGIALTSRGLAISSASENSLLEIR